MPSRKGHEGAVDRRLNINQQCAMVAKKANGNLVYNINNMATSTRKAEGIPHCLL